MTSNTSEMSRDGIQITERGQGNPDSSHASVDVFILSKKFKYLQKLTFFKGYPLRFFLDFQRL